MPESQLILKAKDFEHHETQKRIQEEFSHYEIAAERLQLLPFSPSRYEHLEMYHHIDIALDPFPYSGHTTTCEALWMGVPVIILSGSTHFSRMAVSLMTTASCPEWITHSKEEYIEKAIQLAYDQALLVQIKQTLRETVRNSPLCDGRNYIKQVEKQYRNIWQQWCNDG